MSNTIPAMRRFCWHDLMSTDPAKSAGFLTELFPEWTLTEENFSSPATGSFTFTKIALGDVPIGSIVPFEASMGFPSHWMSSIAVEDCDAAIARIEEQGGKRCYPTFHAEGVGRFAVVSDAQGAYFKPFQPDNAIQLPKPFQNGVFGWDELLTSDPQAAKAVYHSAFGWESRDEDMGGGMTYTLFTMDGHEVAGAMKTPNESHGPPHWLAYIDASDVDDRVERVKQLGGSVCAEPWDIVGIARIAIVAEPTGAVFGLAKWTKNA